MNSQHELLKEFPNKLSQKFFGSIQLISTKFPKEFTKILHMIEESQEKNSRRNIQKMPKKLSQSFKGNFLGKCQKNLEKLPNEKKIPP